MSQFVSCRGIGRDSLTHLQTSSILLQCYERCTLDFELATFACSFLLRCVLNDLETVFFVYQFKVIVYLRIILSLYAVIFPSERDDIYSYPIIL